MIQFTVPTNQKLIQKGTLIKYILKKKQNGHVIYTFIEQIKRKGHGVIDNPSSATTGIWTAILMAIHHKFSNFDAVTQTTVLFNIIASITMHSKEKSITVG